MEDFEPRESRNQVDEGLNELRLQSRIRSAANERQRLFRWQRRLRWLLGLVVSIFLGLIVFTFNTNQTKNIQENTLPTPSTPNITPTLDTSIKAPSPTRPIADVPRSGSAQPTVRGSQQSDSAIKQVVQQLSNHNYPLAGSTTLGGSFAEVDSLLKRKDFTTAFIQLQRLERLSPTNDTLLLLKGYCLVELSEGHDALIYFEKIQPPYPTIWADNLEWYRALALLLQEEPNQALVILNRIVKRRGHPFQKEAAKAIRLLPAQ